MEKQQEKLKELLKKELEIIKNHPAELKPTTTEMKIHEKKSTAEKLGRS